jgi:hypothetical protein
MKMNLFIKIMLVIFGLSCLVVLISYIYVASTPQYILDAERMRSTCEKYMAGNDRMTLMWRQCEDAYRDAIRQGENSLKPIVPTPEFKEERMEMQNSLKKDEDDYADKCLKNKEIIKKEYNILAAKNDWYKAGLKVWKCAELTGDNEYKSLGEKAKKNSK